MRCYLVTLFLILTTEVSMANIAKNTSVSKFSMKEWSTLLFYKKSLFGYEGMVDSQKYYLSKEGKYSPLKEYEENLKVLNTKSWNKKVYSMHPQCLFPTRTKYLKSINKIKLNISCADLSRWKSSLAAKSLSLIYSSEYAGNPSSMFGHVFVKVNQETNNEIMDYTISFSAITNEEDWAPKYVYKGLTGGYPGVFQVAPYYQKIGEYNGKEGRDLFSYKLNLTPNEVEKFLDKVWEFYSTAYFDYYFFNENCSGLLKDIFKWLKPTWKFQSKKRPFYLPEDLIIDIASQDGSIKSKKSRPSLSRKLTQLFKEKNISEKQLELTLNETNQNGMLNELLIPYLQLKKIKGFDINERRYRSLLLASANSTKGNYVKRELSLKLSGPEKTHGGSLISTGIKIHDDDVLNSFRYRMGHLDLMKGHSRSSLGQFSFLDINLNYDLKENMVILSKINILEIISFEEDYLAKYPFSYFVKVMALEKKKSICSSCSDSYISGGLGKTSSFDDGSLTGYLGIQSGIKKSFYLSPQFKLLFKYSSLKNLNHLIEGEVLYDVVKDSESKFEENLTLKNQFDVSSEFSIGLHHKWSRANKVELIHSLSLIKSF